MKNGIYFLNVLYIALVPTLAVVTQGGFNHEFFSQFQWLPDNTSNILNILMWIFVVVLIAILVQTIKPVNNLKASLGLLFGGPVLGLIITLVLDGKLSYTFFNLFLIQGACFIMVMLLQIFRHRKRGVKEAGPIIVYVATPILFLVFILGFIGSINFEFFFALYNGIWDYVALIACTITGLIGMYTFLDTQDKEFRANNPNLDLSDEKLKEIDTMGPFAVTGMLIGIFTFMASEFFLNWSWLTELLQ